MTGKGSRTEQFEELNCDAFAVKSSGDVCGDLDLQDPSEFSQLKQDDCSFICSSHPCIDQHLNTGCSLEKGSFFGLFLDRDLTMNSQS